MKKQNKSMLVLAIFTAFVAMAVFLPGMTLTVEAAEAVEAAPPKKEKKDKKSPAPVPNTGQTMSYADRDDGDLQKGVAWPDPRFTDCEDGTVTDNLTGLMWTKDALYGAGTWSEALSVCASCIEGDYSDWRLPNVKELQSLINYGECAPALSLSHPFLNLGGAFNQFWTSTTWSAESELAYQVWIYDGSVFASYKDDYVCVWCVRGGK